MSGSSLYPIAYTAQEHSCPEGGSADTLTCRCGAQHSVLLFTGWAVCCCGRAETRGFSCSKEWLEPAVCPLPCCVTAQNSPPWERCNFSLSHDKDWEDPLLGSGQQTNDNNNDKGKTVHSSMSCSSSLQLQWVRTHTAPQVEHVLLHVTHKLKCLWWLQHLEISLDRSASLMSLLVSFVSWEIYGSKKLFGPTTWCWYGGRKSQTKVFF